MMIKFLSSPLLTVLFALLMSLYIVQGRFFGGSLYPHVMVSLACLAAAQSVWAIIYRFFQLTGRVPPTQLFPKKKKAELLDGKLEGAASLLNENGFSQVSSRNGKEGRSICFMKRTKGPTVLEIAAYSALVFIIISRILNYGFGISGEVNVSPGGEMIDMDAGSLERGFFADRFPLSFKIKASSITDTIPGAPSTAILEVMDNKSGEIETHRVGTGERITVNRLRMQYRGDAYMAVIAIYNKSHDYRPVPIRYESWKVNPEKPYSAPFYIRTSGVTGEGAFDPVSRKLRVRVYRDETVEFDGELLSGTREYQGDMMVQFNSLMHYGAFDISRYGYRNQIIGGMVALVLFLVLRIIFRPGTVCLRTEDDRVFFYTRDRSIKRLLLKER